MIAALEVDERVAVAADHLLHPTDVADVIARIVGCDQTAVEAHERAGTEDAGFTASICWTFQPTHAMARMEAVGGPEYLRTLAVSRLYLQNVANFQSSWVTMGPKVGQMALWFGCNDMGSTMIEENVVSSAGVSYSMSSPELRRLIESAGFRPRQRNFFYETVEAKFLDTPGRTRKVVGADPTNLAMPARDFEPIHTEAAIR